MVLPPARNRWVIALTFIVALMLTIAPLPPGMAAYRPEWVGLVVIYWCMALPHRVGMGWGWILGLSLDVLRGAIFGEHALGLALVAFLVTQQHRRLRAMPRLQQALVVLTLIMLMQFTVWWIEGITGHARQSWQYWAPSLTSALLWPPAFALLRRLRRRYRVT